MLCDRKRGTHVQNKWAFNLALHFLDSFLLYVCECLSTCLSVYQVHSVLMEVREAIR